MMINQILAPVMTYDRLRKTEKTRLAKSINPSQIELNIQRLVKSVYQFWLDHFVHPKPMVISQEKS